MTRDAIEVMKAYRDKLIKSASNQLDGDIEAFEIAIQALENEEEVYMRGYEQGRKDLVNAIGKAKALEQEPILDKISAEIREHCERHFIDGDIVANDVIEIIDKHREREE